ncbi:hypothetical protein [Streptomyces chilikensis]|uniref:hypothetical protein n=1 Tax=Streptomyces chilikensis TaxID=1194079 RepID=UPI00140D403A|nr:hypothetical protein [Streptomyces chilikensis]
MAQGMKAEPRVRVSDTARHTITSGDGAYRLGNDGYGWAGLDIPVPNRGCPFEVRVEATLHRAVEQEEGTVWGYGYGLGVCNSWTGSEAQGFSLQYAFRKEGREVFPAHSVQHYPEVNSGEPVEGIDSEGATHVWSIRYQDGQVALTQDDGVRLGEYPAVRSKGSGVSLLPQNCNGKGVFLRVFNADVTFRDISVTELAD